MRSLFLLTILASMAWLGSTTPIDPVRQLINRPTKDMMFRRIRSAQVKGHEEYHSKGGHPRPALPSLRKGEYYCGNKVCRLQPGEIPEGCNGICQYAMGPPSFPNIRH